MSSTATTVTWVFTTVAVAGGAIVAVQQLSEPPAPVVVEAPSSLPVPEIEIPQVAVEAPIALDVPEIRKPPVVEVVRIDGSMATIAGTGTPGEAIVIMEAEGVLAETEVGADGTFAIVFPYQVPDSGSVLSLFEQEDYGRQTKAQNDVVVMPRIGADPELAKIDDDVIKIEVDNREELSFAGMVYEDEGNATLSGAASPNVEIEIALNDVPIGVTTAGDDGQWRFETDQITVGQHELRLASSDEKSFSVPIERAPVIETQKIVKGDTLWRIAELHYGDGRRYVDIYNVNAQTIGNNPDLIYPDQNFIVPVE